MKLIFFIVHKRAPSLSLLNLLPLEKERCKEFSKHLKLFLLENWVKKIKIYFAKFVPQRKLVYINFCHMILKMTISDEHI